jgi:hypothetical protein
MPDLALVETTCHYCTGVLIYEWNGQEFQSIVRTWMIDPSLNELSYYEIAELIGYAEAKLIDTDHNGTYEIVLTGGVPSSIGDAYFNGPYRSTTLTYMWDGQYYSRFSQVYSPPEYRFQAIQDGDEASLRRNYDEALNFYQDAIFSDKLKSWSADIHQQLIAQNEAIFQRTPTPTELPPDPQEYYQLAAYARYRIMLLHLIRGYQQEAKIVYDTLQEKFPERNAGYPYAEMAKLFWLDYTSSHDLGLSCKAAVNYARTHPEILTPLTGSEYGFWNRTYLSSDVCPFDSTGNSINP